MSATVEVMRNGEWHLVGQYHSIEQAIPIAEDYHRDGDDARVLRSEFAVYVTDHHGWDDGCQDYQGVFFGGDTAGGRFVYASQGSELGGHMAFDTLAEAEAFADRLRTTGDWEIKAPNHPRYGVTLTETEIILPRDLAFGKSGAQ